jgi:hypothetical protein
MAETEEVEELEWDVADPDEMTTFFEKGACLHTTLPSGLLIGWDTCGCGSSVITCGCDPIKMPRYVLKMRDDDKQRAEALEELENERKASLVSTATETKPKRSRASQRPKKKLMKA